ncbi:ribonuclease E [Catenulispora sp. GP43]|uniref:Rne/Rng family ribonuclease n=1 Tax=Catenulispora sp. GP43 TaxID=3156263 RepID=UPI003515B65F
MLDNEPTGVPGEQPDQTSDAQNAAATAATNEGEAPTRSRRRAASRPAGPPQPPEPGSETGPQATGSDDAAAEPESKPKRARKTAAKKVAAPEPETAEADAPAAKKTTRTRTRKKAAEAEPVPGAESAESGQTAGQAADGAPAASAEPPASEESDTTAKGARTRTRRRATSAGTAVEQASGAESGAEAESGRAGTAKRTRAAAADREQAAASADSAADKADTAKSDTDKGEAAAQPETAPRARTRRRATSAGTAAEQAADTAADTDTAGDQPAESASRPTGLASPFANPFAAPQLPAKTAKKAAQAQEAPAEAPAKAKAESAEPAADTDTESEDKPKRTRRRAASAPAGPPRAQDEAAESKPDRQQRQDKQQRPDKQQRQDKQDRRDKGAQPAAPEPAAEGAEAVDLESLSPAERARAIIAARAAAPAAGVLFQAPDLTTAAAQKAAVKAAKAEATEEEAEAETEVEAEAAEEQAPTRRTRTRNRNRNRAEQAESAAEDAEAEAEDEGDEDEEGTGSSSRRRRRRRRRAGGESVEPGPDDPPNTVVKVRESRVRSRDRKGGLAADDDVQGVRGSTRLEAKKQRRREGRDTGRRRAPLITEAEFLARRESVERVMVVRQSGDRTQIGVLEDGVLVEHYVNRAQSASYVGNVYLGKVQNVLPSMEAAFVDIGKGRNAVLYAGEVNFDAAGITGHAKRIESVLKSGQAVLTQVTKDPIGHKGARLTSQISLPGRYLVYVPEGTMTGISRKLPENERNRLKTILKAVVPEHAGVIVRTAAEGATEDELRRDVERLSAQWEEIQRKAASSASSAPTLLYGEPDLTVRVVRDIFNEDFSKLIVSGDQAWDTIREYVGGVAPDLAPRLERWTSEQDIFAVHRVDEQLAKGLDRKVWLPSGGSLVIDRTEAMVVIDVNTGKFTGSGGNLEETVTRNNIEAAEEIVRQLRLRDLGGIIVIDFIDMVLESNRDLVMRRLLECLGRDRTKHQVAEVTSLGLIQMTRKRVGQGLLEAFSETCDKCNGRGVLVHMEPVPVGHSHGHGAEDGAERDGRGSAGKGGRAGESRAEGGQGGAEEEHEGGRGRRKRRKSHGHADRQQHFDPQYDVDGVPEEFQDFADGEHAQAGPVTVTRAAEVAAADGRAQDEAAELSEHSEVERIPSHEHVVAPVVTPGDVVAAEEADVTERLAAGDAQAHTVYVPPAGAGVSAAAADREETEAQAAGQAGTAPVATAVAVADAPEAEAEADGAEAAEAAPKRRGLRVRRAAKRPAGPPAAHN